MKSTYAAQRLIDRYAFDNIIDIGAGDGRYAKMFLDAGKYVDTVDILPLDRDWGERHTHYQQDFMTGGFDPGYDAVWCAHFLEHQPNVNKFLIKVGMLVNPGGVICISVPPMKPNIVGGHLTLWNAGLVLYNLVRAGIDCSCARVKQEGYNIAVIVPEVEKIQLPELKNDCGDIETLARYFPPGCREQGFNGNIQQMGW